MEESLQDVFDKVMDTCLNHLCRNGKLDNSTKNADELIDIIEGLPGLLYKWVNGMGSLAWILEWTPEKMETYLHSELERALELVKTDVV